MVSADDIRAFWFDEAGPTRWFKRSRTFDELCRDRFLCTFEAAMRGECWAWRQTPAGRCAEIILLDQFSRNLFRDSPRAFAQDSMALALAQEAVASGDHLRMNADERYFTYMPYMHSESLAIHSEAQRLFEALGNAEALRYEVAHRELLERFGRYPGRNAALGRDSTEEELAHLQEHGSF